MAVAPLAGAWIESSGSDLIKRGPDYAPQIKEMAEEPHQLRDPAAKLEGLSSAEAMALFVRIREAIEVGSLYA